MANDPTPAVLSLENDQSTEARRRETLQNGLEDTFPASDPVSATTTAIPARSARSSSRRALRSDAPRVDEALDSILEHRNDPYVEPREQVAAIRDEVESLRYRAAADVRSRIRSNPWQAVGIAAAVGFIFGITR